LFAACGDQPVGGGTNISTPAPSAASPTPQPTPQRPILDAGLQNLIGTTVSFEETSNGHMQEFLSGIRVSYANSGLFNIEAALEKYNALPPYTVHSNTFIVGNTITNIDGLRAQVSANTDAFLEARGGSLFTELSANDFNRVFGTVVDTMQFWMDRTDVIDLNRLDERLGGLILVNSNGGFYSGAVYNNFNGLGINTGPGLDVRQEQNPHVNYFYHLATHEAIHLIHVALPEERQARGFYSRTGPAHRWESLDFNPLNFTWYVEAATEQLTMITYGNTQPTSYVNHVRLLELMTFAIILREGTTATTLAEIALQHELAPLFDVFNAETYDRQHEVLEMLFSQELIFTNANDFFRATELTRADLGERSLRNSFSKTVARNFYSALSYRLAYSPAALEDVFFLISVFESGINRWIRYATNSLMEHNRDFIRDYAAMQNEFFGLLAYETGITPERITEAYNAYNESRTVYATVESTFLNNYEIAFFQTMAEALEVDRVRSINAVYAALDTD